MKWFLSVPVHAPVQLEFALCSVRLDDQGVEEKEGPFLFECQRHSSSSEWDSLPPCTKLEHVWRNNKGWKLSFERLLCRVLWLDNVPLLLFFETLSCGWGRRATAGSMGAEKNLPLSLYNFAATVWCCVKQIVLYKHLFKLIEKLFCAGQ